LRFVQRYGEERRRVRAVMAVQRRHSTLIAETIGRDNPAPNGEPPSE